MLPEDVKQNLIETEAKILHEFRRSHGVVEVVNVFNWHTVAAFRVTGNLGQVISNPVEKTIYGIVDHKDLHLGL